MPGTFGTQLRETGVKWEKKIIVVEGGAGVQDGDKSAFCVVFDLDRRKLPPEFTEIT